MASVFDSEIGSKAAHLLDTEHMIWLTAVNRDGMPQPNVVWFVRDADDVIVYTQQSARRREHIAHNPHVSLNFDSRNNGESMVVLTGTASEDHAFPAANVHPAYMAKYGEHIQQAVGMTAKQYGESYCIALRIRIDRVRGW